MDWKIFFVCLSAALIRDSASKCNFAIDLSEEGLVGDGKYMNEISHGKVSTMYDIDATRFPTFVCDDDFALDRAKQIHGDEQLCLSRTSRQNITDYMKNSRGEMKRIYKRLDAESLGSIKIATCNGCLNQLCSSSDTHVCRMTAFKVNLKVIEPNRRIGSDTFLFPSSSACLKRIKSKKTF